jgi:hypothetical protein
MTRPPRLPSPLLLAAAASLVVVVCGAGPAPSSSSWSPERPLLPLPTARGAVGHAWMFGARATAAAVAAAAGGAGAGGGPMDPPAPSREAARVVFVCSEFAGIVPNGGIGTFYSALAESLAEAGRCTT